MTRLVSVDRDDDYVVQLKTQRQKTHCKNNQLSDCATIKPNVNSVINGKRALFSGLGRLLHAVQCRPVR